MHGLDVLADLENVKQFIQKQKLLKSFEFSVIFIKQVWLHVGHIYVLYVHVPVVVDSVRYACMLQCVKCLLVPRLCVVPVFMYVY